MLQQLGACGSAYPLVEDATIAVPSGKLRLVPASGKPFTCGDKYYIDGFGDTIFTVKDTGTFVTNDGRDYFDVYVGAQTYYDFYHNTKYQYDGLPQRVAKAQP